MRRGSSKASPTRWPAFSRGNTRSAAPATLTRTLPYPAAQFYEMAVKDAFCNHAAGLPEGLADLDVSHLCEEISPGWWKCKFHEDSCEEEKWVGAPDKEGDLGGRWALGLCDGVPVGGAIFPFVWYFIFSAGLLGYLAFHIYSLKEELLKAPRDDTEMGARPPVATAVATAVATPVAVATATPAVAVATATPTPVAA